MLYTKNIGKSAKPEKFKIYVVFCLFSQRFLNIYNLIQNRHKILRCLILHWDFLRKFFKGHCCTFCKLSIHMLKKLNIFRHLAIKRKLRLNPIQILEAHYCSVYNNSTFMTFWNKANLKLSFSAGKSAAESSNICQLFNLPPHVVRPADWPASSCSPTS